MKDPKTERESGVGVPSRARKEERCLGDSKGSVQDDKKSRGSVISSWPCRANRSKGLSLPVSSSGQVP